MIKKPDVLRSPDIDEAYVNGEIPKRTRDIITVRRRNIATAQRDADAEYYEPLIKEMYEALKAAEGHLDYCGYGDKWERECAYDSKLPETIDKALAKVDIKKGL